MTTHEFIFSNQPKYRIGRHLIFWILFSLHFVMQNLMIGGIAEAKTSRNFFESAIHLLYFLPFYLLTTYFIIEVLLPKFLFRKQYVNFVISFFVVFGINLIAVYYSGLFYFQHVPKHILGQLTSNANRYHIIVDGLFVPCMLYGITAGIKFSKKWYLQQRENEKLAGQKLATELQLLKTSIHPRFLFHSLHTVEKHVENSSPQTPSLILQLSDLLSYVLYENDKKWVALEKELEIIGGYINLEQQSFGNKLQVNIGLPQNIQNKFIVPCVLLSFVENGFEYFLETGQDEPHFAMTIEVHEDVLHFQMRFSKAAKDNAPPSDKFSSIQKQLNNQYAELYHLNILSQGKTFLAELTLPLYSDNLINLKKNFTPNEEPEPA